MCPPPDNAGLYTFTFSLWVCLIPAAIAVVLVGVGLWRRRGGHGGLGWILGGLAFGALFGPMLFLDHVVLDDVGLTQRGGFWFNQTTKGFRYADADRIEIRQETVRKRRAAIWYVYASDGTVQRIDPGDLWEVNTKAIVMFLEARGIDVYYTR